MLDMLLETFLASVVELFFLSFSRSGGGCGEFFRAEKVTCYHRAAFLFGSFFYGDISRNILYKDKNELILLSDYYDSNNTKPTGTALMTDYGIPKSCLGCSGLDVDDISIFNYIFFALGENFASCFYSGFITVFP